MFKKKLEMLLENHQSVLTHQCIRSLNCDKALQWDYVAFKKQYKLIFLY